MTETAYRDFHIRDDGYPLRPVTFWHDDFDGAPDSRDWRHSDAMTVDEAKRMIDNWHATRDFYDDDWDR